MAGVIAAGDALAQQTGLGASFVGVTLLAVATSLPEVSTTLTAARLGNYSMAVSNIFGSNAFMVALFLVADLVYRQGPIFNAVYLAGIIERKNLTFGEWGSIRREC